MEEITYRVIRSGRKSMSLEVSRELEVIVRAPYRMRDKHIEDFVEKHRGWITQKLEERRSSLARYPEPSAAQLEAWTWEAKDRIPGRVAYYADVMGVVPAGIRYTKNRTRVGSCCRQNKLSFSCRLMRYPPEVLDYVVVHELAHILHKNHGPVFWQTVAAALPDYKAYRTMLRE